MKTPSVVLDAFFPATVQVAGLVLKHRFTVKHWLALEKIRSPLVETGAPVKLLDAVRALYVVAMAPDEVFAKVLTEQFEQDAVALAGRIPMSEASGLVAVVMRHINREFVTAPPTNDDSGGDGDDASPLAGSKARPGRGGSSRRSRKSARRRSTSTRQ